MLRLLGVCDDFFTDRLCRRYGVWLFVAVAIFLQLEMTLKDQVQCWTPAQFAPSHVMYSQAACQDASTLYRQFDANPVPQEYVIQKNPLPFGLGKINYLPIVLLLQGLIFLVVRTLYNYMTHVTGFASRSFMASAYDVINSKDGDWSGLAYSVLELLRKPFPVLQSYMSLGGGIVLVPVYMLAKLGYLLCCLVQFAILCAFLGFNFFTYRFHTTPWEPLHEWTGNQSVRPFPRVVLCDFEIRHQARVHNYVIQCDVTVHQAVERWLFIIWLFLWAAFFLLALSILGWIAKATFYLVPPVTYRQARVTALLAAPASFTPTRDDHGKMTQFVALMTKPDGLFIMQMMEENLSAHALSRLCKAAWVLFLEENQTTEEMPQAAYTGRNDAGMAETVPLHEKTV